MRYALHPGWITSKTDGDRHYIGTGQLARLYKLSQKEYVIWYENCGLRKSDYIHLYPRYDGKYGRPNAKRDNE